ncbi:MAG: homing endonuclease associated repeat-containing protein [Elusimicrobiota bacterium]
MNEKYTKEFLISELNRFVKNTNRLPTRRDMCNSNGYPSFDSYKRHFGSWNNALKIIGITRPKGSLRRYKVNEDFFKRWSNNMSYVLGYWFADGGMYYDSKRNRYTISFVSKDIEHLEKILNLMESDYTVNDKKDGSFRIQINSKTIYHSLLGLKGHDNKSLTADPPDIPKEYVHDFIRGYMDGDGWVSIRYNRNNYPTLGFIGTKEMMDMIISYLGHPNYYKRKYPKRETNTFVIHYYGEKAIGILNILYADAFVFMRRKYDKYQEGLLYKNSYISMESKKGVVGQYLNGMSMDEIGEYHNINGKTVFNILKENGIKTRTISDALKLKHGKKKACL